MIVNVVHEHTGTCFVIHCDQIIIPFNFKAVVDESWR